MVHIDRITPLEDAVRDVIEIDLLRPRWMRHAACRGQGFDAWFSEDFSKDADAARRVCSGCRVRTECLDHALTAGIRHGLWGGSHPRNGRRWKARPRGQPAIGDAVGRSGWRAEPVAFQRSSVATTGVAAMSDRPVFAGRYELGMVLGRGGMAEVRAGWDRRLGRAVAVKTLLPDLAERPAVRRSFEGEARAAARLTHPNAVTVFDVGEEEGVPFLVMEQVIGPTLEHELAGGPLDAGRVRRLGGELLAALGAAHAAGLVHRDVKPANVLMTPDGSAKLADFGIAKAVAGEDAAATEMDLTATGQVCGTIAYMAPERLAGRPATVQSDVYSVGVVLYESLTGARPFAAATPVEMIRAIDQARPVPLRERCPGLDAALVSAVERSMTRNPEDRFPSAADMSAALRAPTEPLGGATGAAPTVMASPATEILAAPPTAVPPASPREGARPVHPGRAALRVPRRRVLALLAVAGLALVLVGSAVALANHKSPSGGTPAVTVPTTAAAVPPETTLTSTSPASTPLATHPPAPSGPAPPSPHSGPPKGKGKH